MRTKGKIKFIITAISIAVFIMYSCVKLEPVSVIPEIAYRNFEVIDTYDTLLGQPVKVGKLEFSFIDGDADLGVYSDIQTDPYLPDSAKYGLFVNFYYKINGVYKINYFTQLNDSNRFDTIPLHQWIQYNQKLDRVGQNKTVKGIIRSDIQIAYSENIKDTFRLEFYIRDRALNKSNIEYTEDYFIER